MSTTVEVAAAIEQEFPELWKLCYPRRYNEVGGARYDSPKAVALAMVDGLLNYHRSGGRGQTEQSEAQWASTMVKYSAPTYYLSRDMAVALTQTTPAEVLDWMNIKMPFDAAAFMLPANILTHMEYGSISFVAYTRNFRNSIVACPHFDPKLKHELHAMNDNFSVFVRTTSGITLHWTYSTEMRLVDLRNEEELIELQEKYAHTSHVNNNESQNFNDADIVAMNRSIKFIFNVLLLMTHKPETVEAAQLVKRVNKGPGKPIEYWQPHVIGRSYKLRYEQHGAATGTHASPRGHWVSGFWREQAHGPSRSLRKTQWIEPYWRGGDID